MIVAAAPNASAASNAAGGVSTSGGHAAGGSSPHSASSLLVRGNSDPQVRYNGSGNDPASPVSMRSFSKLEGSSGSFSAVPARPQSVAKDQTESAIRRLVTALQLLFSLVASIMFVFGLINRADLITGTSGWDEVFVVLGSLFIFPIASLAYETFLRHFPFVLTKSTETKLWYYGLRLALYSVYGTQVGLFMTYLVLYSGPLCWLFLIPDVAVLILIVMSPRLISFAINFYILVLAVKFGIFWPNLDQSDAAQNPFADRDNQFGPNGLVATIMLTIPIIQFPVLISRLAAGMSITEAYTTNMAAVFAHLLHYLDVMEMYMLGLERNNFAGDVQSLILIFVLMGLVSSNLYYVTLFFNDDTVERMLQRLQPNQVMDALGGTGEVSSNDDTLLHYFVWVLFFVDLPYSTMRFVAFIVHGTRISTFFAKNLMMMASVVMMLMQHRRTRS